MSQREMTKRERRKTTAVEVVPESKPRVEATATSEPVVVSKKTKKAEKKKSK